MVHFDGVAAERMMLLEKLHADSLFTKEYLVKTNINGEVIESEEVEEIPIASPKMIVPAIDGVDIIDTDRKRRKYRIRAPKITGSRIFIPGIIAVVGWGIVVALFYYWHLPTLILEIGIGGIILIALTSFVPKRNREPRIIRLPKVVPPQVKEQVEEVKAKEKEAEPSAEKRPMPTSVQSEKIIQKSTEKSESSPQQNPNGLRKVTEEKKEEPKTIIVPKPKPIETAILSPIIETKDVVPNKEQKSDDWVKNESAKVATEIESLKAGIQPAILEPITVPWNASVEFAMQLQQQADREHRRIVVQEKPPEADEPYKKSRRKGSKKMKVKTNEN